MVSRPSPLLVLHSEANGTLRSKGKSEVVRRPTRKEASRWKGEPRRGPTNEVGESGHQEKWIATEGAVGWPGLSSTREQTFRLVSRTGAAGTS